MARLAPCKGCPDRTTGDRAQDCHTTCERYAEFVAQNIKTNKARREYLIVVSTVLEGKRRLQEKPPSGGNKRPWRRKPV